MTLREDGTLDPREQELLHFWGQFCQDWWAASFMSPTVELVDEFVRWLAAQWATEKAQHRMRHAASTWWQTRDLGLFSWERDLLESWARFSLEVHSTDFVPAGPNASYEFATWLASHEPQSRTRLEELDLSIRAFNLLRARDVRFVDQIDLDRLDDPLGAKVKPEIAAKLRRWRDDGGAAGVPTRP
jgi:hypothetical protein